MVDIKATIKIDKPIYGGVSIGRYNGKVVMVEDAIPGEIVEVEICQETPDYYYGFASKILEPSPDRIIPKCIFFNSCGGCDFQYINYNRQIQIKNDIICDCLERIAKLNLNLSPPIIDNQWNYRYRGQFKISRGKMGFYKKSTNDVVDIDKCLIMSDDVNEYFSKVKNLLINDDKFYRIIKEISDIHISCGDSGNILLQTKPRLLFVLDSEWKDLLAKISNVGFTGMGIFITKNRRVIEYAVPYIVLPLLGLGYTVSPVSFIQSNWKLNQIVVEFIRKKLEPLKGKKILDLYSGAGNLSLPLAIDADEIIAVEENLFSVQDGKRNLNVNNIKNCRFVNTKIESLNIKENIDIVIIDPPRKGLTNSAINKILKLQPKTIVYLSCNPSTFSRDLAKFTQKYSVESIRLVDFFPQTYHIEVLGFLELK